MWGLLGRKVAETCHLFETRTSDDTMPNDTPDRAATMSESVHAHVNRMAMRDRRCLAHQELDGIYPLKIKRQGVVCLVDCIHPNFAESRTLAFGDRLLRSSG